MVNGVVTLPPIVTPSAMPPFGVTEIRKRTHAIQEVMKGVMKEGTHYGTIPGTPKASLWKAGAEILCMTFRLAPLLESHVTVDDPEAEWAYSLPRRDGSVVTGTCTGFFEVEATCTIQGPNGEILSRCSARCNNREAKYRSLSLFDIRNTVQKMGEKRAFVSAVLMATGASDLFTQDLEDFPELLQPVVPKVETSEPKLAVSMVKSGVTLSPKREAWLFRAAQEANLPKDAVERCLEYLRTATSETVKGFFDDLAKRKKVFEPFLAAAA
ncbi:MAG: hypothetical protein HY823_08860 [Acidobacteria bacterium]|nr:hypothetical protein [Acidobacteriota bacterium]